MKRLRAIPLAFDLVVLPLVLVPVLVVRLSLEPSQVGSGQSCHLSGVSFESVSASGRIAVLYTFVLELAHLELKQGYLLGRELTYTLLL